MQPDRASSRPDYWFPAKRYGWGWGFPLVWQGWVVFGAFVLAIGGGVIFVLSPLGPFVFAGYVVALIGLLTIVCWLKGEPPRWRWGDDGAP
ncbi:MAG TPA: hypothetical protein VIE63_16690 [Ramlibacter sp.]